LLDLASDYLRPAPTINVALELVTENAQQHEPAVAAVDSPTPAFWEISILAEYFWKLREQSFLKLFVHTPS